METRCRSIKIRAILALANRLVAFLLVFTAIPLITSPQIPTQPPGSSATPAEKEARTVYLTVLDKKGTPVLDLRSTDFSVFEASVPQQVVSVSLTSDEKIVLGTMIDLSGSTKADTKRHEKLNVLLRFLAGAVGDSEEAYITAFAASSRRLTGITTDPKDILSGLRQIDEAPPFGPTALYDALTSSIAELPRDVSGRKVFIVLGDFQDNASHLSLDSAIRDLQRAGVSVFALVDLEPGHEAERRARMGYKVARQMAEETGGETVAIESPQEMETALSHFQLVLKSSYALRYLATTQSRKDGSVPLKIEVRRPDLQLLYSRQRPPAT